MTLTRSDDLFERAQRVTPGGVQSGSRYRLPHPWYFVSAQGAWLTDADGQVFLDCIMGNGAVILGHGHPAVVEAVERALRRGLTCGIETELSIEAAEKVAAHLPQGTLVRFANSGTEAALHAIRIARAATGRDEIAKFEGAYHGWADPVLVSTWPDLKQAGPADRPNPVPMSRGIPQDIAAHTVVLPYNDLAGTEAILREHANELSAVLIEPTLIDMGFVPADRDFITGLRRITAELGIVLVFDELLTGFRLAPGGAQQVYNVQADLCMLGKGVANGMPISVVAGKPELMDLVRPGGPVAFQGTYNGHALSMAAICAVLDWYDQNDVSKCLQQRTDQLKQEFARLAHKHSVPAQLAGGGGHFHPYFMEGEVRDYRSAAHTSRTRYQAFAQTLIERHTYFYTNPLLHHCLSMAHGDTELEQLIEAMDEGLRRAAAVSN